MCKLWNSREKVVDGLVVDRLVAELGTTWVNNNEMATFTDTRRKRKKMGVKTSVPLYWRGTPEAIRWMGRCALSLLVPPCG